MHWGAGLRLAIAAAYCARNRSALWYAAASGGRTSGSSKARSIVNVGYSLNRARPIASRRDVTTDCTPIRHTAHAHAFGTLRALTHSAHCARSRIRVRGESSAGGHTARAHVDLLVPSVLLASGTPSGHVEYASRSRSDTPSDRSDRGLVARNGTRCLISEHPMYFLEPAASPLATPCTRGPRICEVNQPSCSNRQDSGQMSKHARCVLKTTARGG